MPAATLVSRRSLPAVPNDTVLARLAIEPAPIATEFADYSKKSFEHGSAALEKLLGAKSPDKAIEIQSDYVKTAYEGFVAQATKIGELYTDLAKESYKPLEGIMAKVAPAK